MRKRRFSPSRLAIAWIGLGVFLGAAALAVLIVPQRTPAPNAIIPLPAAPDRFAAAEDRGEGTFGEEAATPDGAVPGPTVRERQSDGSVRITVGSDPVPRAADTDRPAPRPTPAGAPVTERGAPPLGPDPALVSASGGGPGPGADGRTPFEAYRRTAPPLREGERQVALMVSGLGLDRELTDRAIETLPPAVTLSFVPYAKDLPALLERARQRGHEVVVEIPMQTRGTPAAAIGPAGLSLDQGAGANAERLEWILARAPAYPLMTNYLGATYTGDADAMRALFATLSERGLGFVDDTGRAGRQARAAGLPYGSAAILVPPTETDVGARLASLTARAGGEVPPLAKVYASEAALGAVEAWAGSLGQLNVVLMPASAAVRTP